MSLIESKVDKLNQYIDTNYSSGDNNGMKCKQFYQEENNNEIDVITKEFSEMGCIVDAVKRPPNICIETCVYEEPESDNENERSQAHDEEVNYSDEFEEEDLSDIEIEKTKVKTVSSESNSKTQIDNAMSKTSLKLSKSQSCTSRCNSQKPGSISGRSTDFGSVSVPSTRRINMSFTNERLREIERHNHILLNKILSARNKRKSTLPPREERPKKPLPPAAVQRRTLQRKIDHDNMILLKKIQRAKSSAYSVRR
ncbi:uncharacterized protein LOC120625102 [Pararge aegeria]|uniref:Jg9962 protein n=2 Tax=Pararge aegeria TaxID=116150 RepID=A0A8S4RZE9_9NEOP|nr:uncharacterized protein LOC120625102 [Pararge aegeria]XP_039747966.1 uncharacterized protein LOC120625102 [Pararge aegeria]XP_039747967.1 uncharacterized protein LOC120625102 [Pararge aegeria]XP_039747968.1 uncharacterized protein LOC120625102 [Pararge aegeria]CAH2242542.1 jg9962 [Pararge aegeria aegeria]